MNNKAIKTMKILSVPLIPTSIHTLPYVPFVSLPANSTIGIKLTVISPLSSPPIPHNLSTLILKCPSYPHLSPHEFLTQKNSLPSSTQYPSTRIT